MPALAQVDHARDAGVEVGDEDLLAALGAPADAEADLVALLRRQGAEHVLGHPDRAQAGEVADPGGVVDGVAEHRELDVGVRVIGAEPLPTLVEAAVQVELVEPVLARLPFPAHLAHHVLELVGAVDGVENVVAVGLGEEVVHHAVADMLAMGAVVLAEHRLGALPDVVDEGEVLLGRQLGADLHRVLEVRHQHRDVGEEGHATLQEVANHLLAPRQELDQALAVGRHRHVGEEDALAKVAGVEVVGPDLARSLGQVDVAMGERALGDRLGAVVELVEEAGVAAAHRGVHPGQRLARQPLLGQAEVEGHHLFAVGRPFQGIGQHQQAEDVARLDLALHAPRKAEQPARGALVPPHQLEVVVDHVGGAGNVADGDPEIGPRRRLESALRHRLRPRLRLRLRRRPRLRPRCRFGSRFRLPVLASLGAAKTGCDIGHRQSFVLEALHLLDALHRVDREVPQPRRPPLRVAAALDDRPGQETEGDVVVEGCARYPGPFEEFFARQHPASPTVSCLPLLTGQLDCIFVAPGCQRYVSKQSF